MREPRMDVALEIVGDLVSMTRAMKLYSME